LTEELLKNHSISNMIKEQRTMINDVDTELNELKRWKEEREAKRKR
jgi:hypothetical protein